MYGTGPGIDRVHQQLDEGFADGARLAVNDVVDDLRIELEWQTHGPSL